MNRWDWDKQRCVDKRTREVCEMNWGYKGKSWSGSDVTHHYSNMFCFENLFNLKYIAHMLNPYFFCYGHWFPKSPFSDFFFFFYNRNQTKKSKRVRTMSNFLFLKLMKTTLINWNTSNYQYSVAICKYKGVSWGCKSHLMEKEIS